MQRRLVLSLLLKMCSAIAVVGLLAGLHAPASAQITVGGAFPPTNMTALGWTSQTSNTCDVGSYYFTFTFLGATGAVRPNPANSVFTVNFTVAASATPDAAGASSSVNGTELSVPGTITTGADVSESDPLITGFTLDSDTDATAPGMAGTASTTCTGSAFFVYKIATNAPNGTYVITFGKGAMLTAFAGGYQGTGDASNLGANCIATHSGSPGGDNTAVNYNGGMELLQTSSQQITVAVGAAYCWTHVPYSSSGTAASTWTEPDGPGLGGEGHAQATLQVRPLQVTITP